MAAHPPFSSKSVMRNSLTQTSPLLISFDLLRTPIIITFTSAKLGFPMILIVFSSLFLSLLE
ncbi:hypothetical protein EVA_11079 [gut metagenome]|uniref:Uncharacterized protein n=1 Tax=gut metagenome TaxID=749906 RepID=J9G0Q6_9ZZZZ